MRFAGCATLLFSILLLPAQLRGAGGVTPRLSAGLRIAAPGERIAVWIYFSDKGPSAVRKGAFSAGCITPRALERRLRVLPASRCIDVSDLPVDASYVKEVERTGAVVRHASKWLNAVSAWVTAESIGAIASLPAVRTVDLLGRFPRDPIRSAPPFETPAGPPAAAGVAQSHSASSPLPLDYGASFPQVNLLNIPAVHEEGNAAQGVLIGVFDNGFRLLTHTAFDSLNVVGMHDFVDHKVSVVPNNPSSAFGSHGVNTLSTIAGYRPGELIGPAFRASYLLARTENDSSETPVEEDNWIAAIEWAESLGVQVTSTSLGYLNYDSPYTSWTWEQMDGQTTPITRAAAMAVRKGVVVVNSAGNNGAFADTLINSLNAPADGDSVLAIGAVTPAGIRASFSSVGPSRSTPPRIKPDIMATGTSIHVASSTDPLGYGTSQGTSFACPLAAGVAAMVLAAHPSATPMEVVHSLKMTASRAGAPNNQYGWGIIDALAAVRYLGGDTSGTLPTLVTLAQNFPNPFNLQTRIRYELPEAATLTIAVYDLLGRKVATLVDGSVPRGSFTAVWNGADAKGAPCASGFYLYRLTARTDGDVTSTIVRKMILLR